MKTIVNAVMSINAVLTVLLLTLLGLLTITHTLFNEILPDTIQGVERVVATWLLSCGWEVSLLLATVNSHLLPKRITLLMAVCSGFIVLFFLHAFDTNQDLLAQRWFIGVLITLINYLYTHLFYSKLLEARAREDLKAKVSNLEAIASEKSIELTNKTQELLDNKSNLEKLSKYVIELEGYKEREIKRNSCPYCGKIMDSKPHLVSHKGRCDKNPRAGLKQTIFEEAL